MRIHKLLIIMLLIFPSLVTAKEKCSRQALDSFRTQEFKSLFDSGKYSEAGEALTKFIEERDCYTALAFDSINTSSDGALAKEPLANLKSYLWALSDSALAFQKAGDTGRCLQIVKTTLNEYHINPLESSGDEKLRRAFEHNEALCLKQREEAYPKAALNPCPLSLLGLKAKKYFETDFSEIPHGFQLPINRIVTSFKAEPVMGMDCVALVYVATPTELMSAICPSLEECMKLASTANESPAEVPAVVAVRKGSPIEIFELSSDSELISRCGDFNFTARKDKESRTLFRLQGSFSPCGGGTARGEADELFSLQDGKLLPVDSAVMNYH